MLESGNLLPSRWGEQDHGKVVKFMYARVLNRTNNTKLSFYTALRRMISSATFTTRRWCRKQNEQGGTFVGPRDRRSRVRGRQMAMVGVASGLIHRIY